MENELVIINKYNIIERCINRINEIYEGNSKNLENYDKQDAIILNLQRACQAAIDLGMHIISGRNLGIPQSKKGTFTVLEENKIITPEMANNLRGVLKFRNIAIHEYQELDLNIVQDIIENHLNDLQEFAIDMLKQCRKGEQND